MQHFSINAPDEQATVRLGHALAETLPAGTTVALIGTLGAGKTRLVQAIAAAVGIEAGTAVSPTFVLVQEYSGARPIVHVDAYRLRDEDEFLALGAEEYLASPAITIIEWADRVAGCLPREHLRIEISETGETSRRFDFKATGPGLEAALDRLAAAYP